jgi:hypothetical protein
MTGSVVRVQEVLLHAEALAPLLTDSDVMLPLVEYVMVSDVAVWFTALPTGG